MVVTDPIPAGADPVWQPLHGHCALCHEPICVYYLEGQTTNTTSHLGPPLWNHEAVGCTSATALLPTEGFGEYPFVIDPLTADFYTDPPTRKLGWR